MAHKRFKTRYGTRVLVTPSFRIEIHSSRAKLCRFILFQPVVQCISYAAYVMWRNLCPLTPIKETYAVWEFHSKIDFLKETCFWPYISSIGQIRDMNLIVYHSKISKSTFIFMIHHCDVINTSLKRVNQKTYLTHHS